MVSSTNRTQTAFFSGIVLPILLGIFTSLCVGSILVALLLTGYEKDRIYPGIYIEGVDVGGLTPTEAQAKLTGLSNFTTSGRIVITDGKENWLTTPEQLGYHMDLPATTNAAYQFGRNGSWIANLFNKVELRFYPTSLPLVLVNDQSRAQEMLVEIASKVNTPVHDASFQIDGVTVNVLPGQIGREVDITATLASIQNQLATRQDAVIPLTVTETQPLVMDLSTQADHVRKILSAPLAISMPSDQLGSLGPWAIGQEDLAKMLVFSQIEQNGEVDIAIQVNQDLLGKFLQNLLPVINQSALNARYIFNDDTGVLDLLEHAQIGREVDFVQSLADATRVILQGDHAVTLTVKEVTPRAKDDTPGADLGITELVHQETSYFYGSNASRVNNIRTAASRFHGLVIAPGEVLSMAEVIGDISLDSGFSEALIIFGNETIKGVGGGVCQVSTTLFRAAFFTGFPILERYAHAYRVGYYEQTYTGAEDPSLAGLDATVFIPMVDMKFKNDTPYWLLMETYTTETSLTWKFYSTADGRSVQWETTGPENIIKAPKAKYVENKELPEGKIKQIDWAAEGADITVQRIVKKDGQEYFSDSFYTHYVPWQAVYEYGPGTKLPKKADTGDN